MRLDPPDDLSEVFDCFDSAQLERLAAFAENVEELQAMSFARNLDKLGGRPKVTALRRRPGGGGFGLLNVRSASHEARASVFAVIRRLRSEHEFGSLAQACGVLRGAARRRGSDDATWLSWRIDALRKRLRDAEHREAVVGATVTDADGSRSYLSREQVTELVEYGQHFHQGDDTLRRDWRSLPTALMEPSIDDALRVTAEGALALYPLATAVLDDPALLRR